MRQELEGTSISEFGLGIKNRFGNGSQPLLARVLHVYKIVSFTYTIVDRIWFVRYH